MTAKQTVRKILFDLREWARIEQTMTDVPEPALKPWRDVEDWCMGMAKKLKVDLSPTADEKLARLNRAFPERVEQ